MQVLPLADSPREAIEQIVKASARQPVIARFAWTDNAGHAVAARGPAIKAEAPGWFTDWVALPVLEELQPVVVGGTTYGTVSLTLNPTGCCRNASSCCTRKSKRVGK